MNITNVKPKEKLMYLEISARKKKTHLSAVVLGLKVMLFSNKSIGFYYCLEHFNDYPPFKCSIVV